MRSILRTRLFLGILCLGMIAQPMSAQIPKMGGLGKKAKDKAVKTAKNDVSSGSAAAQRMETQNKKLKDLADAPDWGNKDYIGKFQYALGYLPGEVAKAKAGGAADKTAAKKYEKNFTEYTDIYQANVELTSLIISRFMDAAVAYERIDGTCRYEEARFTQDYNGGGAYGKCFWDGVGTNKELSCKNINK